MQQSARRGARIARAAVPTAALGLGLMVTLAGPPAPLSAQVSPRATAPALAAESVVERALESRSKGSPDAAVVVFEIADFQCPYCATFAATVAPILDERYVEPGQVQWIFVNLPSTVTRWRGTPPRPPCAPAPPVTSSGPCTTGCSPSRTNGARTPTPPRASPPTPPSSACPPTPTPECTEGDQVAPLILQDLGSAISAGITGTPTFIIMKGQEVVERMVGVQTVEEWSQVLDRALGR
jgi:hypothetical protein